MYNGHLPDQDGYYWYFAVYKLQAGASTREGTGHVWDKQAWPVTNTFMEKSAELFLQAANAQPGPRFTSCIIVNLIPLSGK